MTVRAARSLLLATLCACAAACASDGAREASASSRVEISAVTASTETTPAAAGQAAAGPSASAARPNTPPIPRIASGDMPAYPRMSRRIGEEGWVEVAIDLREDGEVVGLAVSASSGSQRLEDAVLTAARTWRFWPRTGERGIDRIQHRFVFQLTRG